MNFCSNCGSANLNYRIPEGDHFPRFVCEDCLTIHYSNPKMVVGCIVEKEGKIMLAKRGIEPRFGYWNLPCGYLENDETIEQGARREVMEETGANVELENLHTVYNLPHADQVYLIFKSKMIGDEFHVTHESTEIRFFGPEEIPWEELAFSSNSFAIKKFIENKRHDTTTHIGSYFKKGYR